MQFHPLPDIATWHIHLRFHAPRRSTCGSWRLTGDGVGMKWVEIGYMLYSINLEIYMIYNKSFCFQKEASFFWYKFCQTLVLPDDQRKLDFMAHLQINPCIYLLQCQRRSSIYGCTIPASSDLQPQGRCALANKIAIGDAFAWKKPNAWHFHQSHCKEVLDHFVFIMVAIFKTNHTGFVHSDFVSLVMKTTAALHPLQKCLFQILPMSTCRDTSCPCGHRGWPWHPPLSMRERSPLKTKQELPELAEKRCKKVKVERTLCISSGWCFDVLICIVFSIDIEMCRIVSSLFSTSKSESVAAFQLWLFHLVTISMKQVKLGQHRGSILTHGLHRF